MRRIRSLLQDTKTPRFSLKGCELSTRIVGLLLWGRCCSLIYSFSARIADIQNLDSPVTMKMKVYYHDNCFDGLASAAVFSNFFRHGVRSDAEFEYEGLAHR